jgi:putative SOS response-associated peptidase YedK
MQSAAAGVVLGGPKAALATLEGFLQGADLRTDWRRPQDDRAGSRLGKLFVCLLLRRPISCLDVDNRCLVPFSSFAEPERGPDGKVEQVWFAFDETRPLACFAGLWTRWTSTRKVREGETTSDIYGFLTINPNVEVGAVHPKAMPVILQTPEECDMWLTAPTVEALRLQRPLPDGALTIVARGGKTDEPQRSAAVSLDPIR